MHPADVLIDPIRNREQFTQLLKNWFDRHGSWRDARARFFNSFADQSSYDHDRLIACANMFAIGPFFGKASITCAAVRTPWSDFRRLT